jgi:uncharacterized membrane protein YkvA (DUF1232 family)
MNSIASASERESIGRIIDLPMRAKLRLAMALLGDGRITPAMEAPLFAVVAYVLLPIHVVPRRLFFLRPFDDLIVAAMGLWLFVKLAPPSVLAEHLDRIEGETRHG